MAFFEKMKGMTKNKIKGYEKYNIEFDNDPELLFAFKLSLAAVDFKFLH